MTAKKQLNEQVQALRRLQSNHKNRARKVEKTRLKLERQRRRLTALEARIAQLEHRISHAARGDGRSSRLTGKELRSIRVIFNSKLDLNGGGENNLEKVVEALRAHGIRAEICLKTSGKIARKCARQAAKENEGMVIVAGGDGTIEDVASELVGTKTALGIIPLGTMNNLARSLGIPLDISDACELIAAGITRPIDVGRVREADKPQNGYFLETAGLGLSGIALPAGQDAHKGRWGKLPEAISRLFSLEPAPVEVQLDHEVVKADSQLVTVSNAPLTGANLTVAPDAKMDDGMLDVTIYDRMRKAEILAFLMEGRNGKCPENPNVHRYRARHVAIRSSEKMPAVSDKDAIPAQHLLDIELVPQALSAVVGNGIGLTMPVESVPASPPLTEGQTG